MGLQLRGSDRFRGLNVRGSLSKQCGDLFDASRKGEGAREDQSAWVATVGRRSGAMVGPIDFVAAAHIALSLIMYAPQPTCPRAPTRALGSVLLCDVTADRTLACCGRT